MPQEKMTEQLVRQIELLRARVEDLESRKFPQLFGTWTPTISDESNIDSTSVSSNSGHYLIIGPMLLCWGSLDVNPTSSGSTSFFRMDLPIAATLDNAHEGAGSISKLNGKDSGVVRGDEVNEKALMAWTPTHTDNAAYYYIFAVHNQT